MIWVKGLENYAANFIGKKKRRRMNAGSQEQGYLVIVQDRNWQTKACGPKPAHHLCFWMKFYWNTTMPTYLHIDPGCFCATTTEIGGLMETTQPSDPRIFTIWPFTKKPDHFHNRTPSITSVSVSLSSPSTSSYLSSSLPKSHSSQLQQDLQPIISHHSS